jgi:hypothetical protein
MCDDSPVSGAKDAGGRLDARLRDAGERLDRIEERLAERRARDVQPPPAPDRPTSRHVLFVPSPSGYVLVERDGAPPAPGERVEVPERDGSFAVTKVVGSPLPGDDRRCAYLQLT